jgi:ketosteroid isomerase-like protein
MQDDRELIRELNHRYADSYDRNDPAGYVGTFTNGAVIDNSAIGLPAASGAAEIKKIFLAYRGQQTHTVHMVTNHLVDPAPETADERAGQCYFYALSVLADGSTSRLIGRYEDVYRRTPAGWRIHRRRLVPLMPVETGGPEK